MTLGMGVMLHMLGGGTEHEPKEYYGRTIVAAHMEEEAILLSFADGASIKIYDDGQTCCESRYMRTDDDVQSLVGGTLVSIEAKRAKDEEDEWGDVHQIVFIEIQTDKGFITIANHNEHNGYYGGFGMTIREVVA